MRAVFPTSPPDPQLCPQPYPWPETIFFSKAQPVPCFRRFPLKNPPLPLEWPFSWSQTVNKPTKPASFLQKEKKTKNKSPGTFNLTCDGTFLRVNRSVEAEKECGRNGYGRRRSSDASDWSAASRGRGGGGGGGGGKGRSTFCFFVFFFFSFLVLGPKFRIRSRCSLHRKNRNARRPSGPNLRQNKKMSKSVR